MSAPLAIRPPLAPLVPMAAVLLVIAPAVGVDAQPGAVGELLHVDGSQVLVRSGPTGLSVAGPRGPARSVWRTPIGVMSSAAREPGGGVAVAAVGNRVHVAFVPIANGAAGRPVEHTIDRLSGSAGAAVGITITARGSEGFTVFWQEAPTNQPGGTWRTYRVELDSRARPVGAASEIPVPWPLADAIFSGDQYLLLVYYARGAPDQTMFCGVHISRAGGPTEHPYYAARAGSLDEAQLVDNGGRIVAVYRGGPRGTDLLQVDVSTGRWGQQPPESTPLGPIGGDVAFGARAEGGAVLVERRPLR